jgi:hypothetical protein
VSGPVSVGQVEGRSGEASGGDAAKSGHGKSMRGALVTDQLSEERTRSALYLCGTKERRVAAA